MTIAVVQQLPGIGDMIWHLPHIRAIAAHHGAPITLIAKPRSAADQIFSGEDTIRDFIWLDRNPDGGIGKHDGFGLLRMAAAIHARGFQRVYLLHHSRSIATLMFLARIPARYGYGVGLQRLFLNRRPFLSEEECHLTPPEQASAWLRRAGIVQWESEPTLAVDPRAREAMRGRFESPAVVVGIGTSEPYKQWGAKKFAALTRVLRDSGWQSVVLAGGKAERALAEEIRAVAGDEGVVIADGWHLSDVIALCHLSGFYVGNDTGVMNLAAAAGRRAYGLFGATPVLTHTARIVGIEPPGGIDKATGMDRISLDQVLTAIVTDRGRVGP